MNRSGSFCQREQTNWLLEMNNETIEEAGTMQCSIKAKQIQDEKTIRSSEMAGVSLPSGPWSPRSDALSIGSRRLGNLESRVFDYRPQEVVSKASDARERESSFRNPKSDRPGIEPCRGSYLIVQFNALAVLPSVVNPPSRGLKNILQVVEGQ